MEAGVLARFSTGTAAPDEDDDDGAAVEGQLRSRIIETDPSASLTAIFDRTRDRLENARCICVPGRRLHLYADDGRLAVTVDIEVLLEALSYMPLPTAPLPGEQRSGPDHEPEGTKVNGRT